MKWLRSRPSFVVPLLVLVLSAGCLPALGGRGAIPPPPTPESTVGYDPRSWVEERLEAVALLFGLTPEGRDLIFRLDVRHVRGDPGFFGSYGYRGWTGIGEAKPGAIVHELGHAYWGAFPVTGRPDLRWDDASDVRDSSALRAYHRDVLAFLRQPPDRYELLRQRLRNLPALSAENTEPLFHTAEADMVSLTGGDLSLIPPVLRRYWDRFLAPGPYGDWRTAVAWYLGLQGEERRLADTYLGFQHLDLRRYRRWAPDSPTHLDPERLAVLEREERQRFVDFARDFDLMVGNPDRKEDFNFWRGYLRDMVRLYRQYPEALEGLPYPRSPQVGSALGFLASLDGMPPQERASAFASRMAEEPFLANFLPALDNETLLALFGAGAPIPEAPTLEATRQFVEQLERYRPLVEQVASAGARSGAEGARALRDALAGVDLKDRSRADLFFEMLNARDRQAVRSALKALDRTTLLTLVKAVPVWMRFLLEPGELVPLLGVGPSEDWDAFTKGLETLLRNPAGNYVIDEPYWMETGRVLALRGEREPGRVLALLGEVPFPLDRWILDRPEEVASLLARDLDSAVDLVLASDPVVVPPARLVYLLIHADPQLSARIVGRLDSRGSRNVVLDSLAFLAYDAERLEENPDLPISLDRDGLFLGALSRDLGPAWLRDALTEARRAYEERVQAGELDPDFVTAWRTTLLSAVDTLPAEEQTPLRTVVEEVFPGT